MFTHNILNLFGIKELGVKIVQLFFHRFSTKNFFFNFGQWNFLLNFLFLGGFKDSASPVMEGIIDFHHEVFYIMIFVVCFVGWLLSRIFYIYTSKTNPLRLRIPVYNVPLEIVWTIIPICLLALTVLPSFSLLYAINDLLDPTISIKVIGNQWYWIYEFTFFTEFSLA